MNSKIKIIVIGLSTLYFIGCAGKVIDIEPLSDGSYLIRKTGATFSEDKETTLESGRQEAEQYCKDDGRTLMIRKTKAGLINARGVPSAVIEFECLPVVTPRRH